MKKYTVYFFNSSIVDPHELGEDFQIAHPGQDWNDAVRGDGHSYRGPAFHEPLDADTIEEAHQIGHAVLNYRRVMKAQERSDRDA